MNPDAVAGLKIRNFCDGSDLPPRDTFISTPRSGQIERGRLGARDLWRLRRQLQ